MKNFLTHNKGMQEPHTDLFEGIIEQLLFIP